MSCVCAPTLDAEMDIWVSLGGGNSGCCGDKNHTYGFHCPANRISVRDYSRRYDPGMPYNMNWACAADFSHKNNPSLRAMHLNLLARLMRGELPTVDEFIGKPWADRPVVYWFRPNGINKLKNYTGAGHDHWSHIGVRRSRSNEPLGLWVPGGSTPVVYKPKPGALAVDNELGPKTIARWQQVMGAHVDGVISRDSRLVRAVQRFLNASIGAGLVVDGDGIWQNGRRSHTIAALQRYLQTPVDGRLSTPKSMAVGALQRRLNAGSF